MAQLIRKNSEPSAPEPKNGANRITAVIFLALAVICGIIYLFEHSDFILVACGFSLLISISVFISGVSFSSHFTPGEKRFGDYGEQVAGSVLERYLPDGYTVIQNAKIRYKDGVSETDNIVIGKTGVFIVEVKYMKGTVYADYNEKYWLKEKTDRYDIEHEKEFYSPVKQVKTHIYRLANFLRDNGVFTYIKGAVYFAADETEVIITDGGGDVPIFTYYSTELLLDYLTRGERVLSEREIQKVIRLLV